MPCAIFRRTPLGVNVGVEGELMPKVEVNGKLHRRLEAMATNGMTVEMLVNRAIDHYLNAQTGGSHRGPNVRILPKQTK
jgi:hypothetical protein